MSFILPTMKVKRDGPRGFRLINVARFDPTIHEVYDPNPEPAVCAPSADEIEAMTKADAVAALRARGIEFDGRLGVEALRNILADALAPADKEG